MRILHCVSTLGLGGAERQLAYLVAEQVRRGHDVHVARANDGAMAERVARSGASLHRLQGRGNHDPRLLWQLYRMIGKLSPDVVHTRLLQMDVLGGAAAIVRRVPWVLSERSSAVAYAGNRMARLRAIMARYAAAIETNSSVGAAYWSELRADVAVRIIPAGMPLDEIAAAAPADPSTLGIAAGTPLILFAGRFSEEKNVLLLLDALARLFARRDAVAVLCGSGPLEAEARQRADALGIAGRVRFPGLIDNVWNWMKSARVFVAPSVFEGRPNSVMEAAAARCPLVVSEIAAHRELLDDQSALFVASHDADAIAGAMKRVLDEPADAACRAARAFQAMSSFSVAAMAERVDMLYREIVHKP